MANRRRARGRVAGAIAVALSAIAVACGSPADLEPCGTIPAGGCPVGRGGTCDDPSCAGVYDCVDGRWQSMATCASQVDGGASDGGARDAGGGDAACGSVTVDHTGEATGCKPDLQVPDCSVAAAEMCAVEACLTGCEDFFLCTTKGWRAVAYCDDSGQIVSEK